MTESAASPPTAPKVAIVQRLFARAHDDEVAGSEPDTAKLLREAAGEIMGLRESREYWIRQTKNQIGRVERAVAALATPPAHSHQQGRCGTCKHFAADVAHKPYGSCNRWHTGYGYNRNALPTGEVLVENDEGWAMVMGPEFGCVLHEPTDPKAAAGEEGRATTELVVKMQCALYEMMLADIQLKCQPSDICVAADHVSEAIRILQRAKATYDATRESPTPTPEA